MKLRIAFLVAAALASFIALHFSTCDTPKEPNLESLPPPTAASLEEQLQAAIDVPANTDDPLLSSRVAVAPPDAPRIELARGKLPWESRIESITTDASLSDSAKARALFAMIPGLPEHALQSAAEKAAKRVPDAEYSAILLPVLANPQTHGAVASVLFADLMERRDPIALPALLRIAQVAHHPFAAPARDNLNLLLDVDYGEDWLKWSAAVQAALQKK
jgi:hypothetical protein